MKRQPSHSARTAKGASGHLTCPALLRQRCNHHESAHQSRIASEESFGKVFDEAASPWQQTGGRPTHLCAISPHRDVELELLRQREKRPGISTVCEVHARVSQFSDPGHQGSTSKIPALNVRHGFLPQLSGTCVSATVKTLAAPIGTKRFSRTTILFGSPLESAPKS